MTYTYTFTSVTRHLAPLALVLLGVLFSPQAATADSVTLAWDPNSEPEVTGYFVYVGTQPGAYSQVIDVGNTNKYTFSALPGRRYYFAVAAYAGSLVSVRSNEVSAGTNTSPVLVNPGNQSGRAGQAVSLLLTASDPGGAPLTYAAAGLPQGLAISPALGFISGTPTTAGTYSVTATASNGLLAAQQTFSWVVQDAAQNLAPSLVNPGPRSSTVGQQILLQLQGADPNGDAFGYSAVGLPPGLQVAPATGNITGKVATAGTFSVTISVSDGQWTNRQSFIWTVSALDIAPTLAAIAAKLGTIGQATSLQLEGSDANGDALTYSASGLPPGLSINASTGLIAGTPTVTGTYIVTTSVSDGTFTVRVSDAFSWTIATSGNVAVTLDSVGQAATPPLQGSGASSNPPAYRAPELPPAPPVKATGGPVAATPAPAGPVTAPVSSGPPIYWAPELPPAPPVKATGGPVAATPATPGPVTAPVSGSATPVSSGPPIYPAPELPPAPPVKATGGPVAATPAPAGPVTAPVSGSAPSVSSGPPIYPAPELPPAPPVKATGGPVAATPAPAGPVTAPVSGSAPSVSSGPPIYPAPELPPAPPVKATGGPVAATPTSAGPVNAPVSGSAPSVSSGPPTNAAPELPLGVPATPNTGSVASAPAAAATATTEPVTPPGPAAPTDTAAPLASDSPATIPAARRASASAVFTGTTATARSSSARSEPAPRLSSARTEPPAKPITGERSVTGAMTTSTGSVTRPTVSNPLTEGTQALSRSAPGGDPASIDRSTNAPGAAPTIGIETPVQGATLAAAGGLVIFGGVARDAGDADLANRIVWISSRDGPIGTGGLLHKALTAGTHVITASVTDGGGNTRSAQVTIKVGR